MAETGGDMGTLQIEVEIGNAAGTQFETVEVMVDTGATFTQVPAELLRRLGVEVGERAPVRLGDGRLSLDEVGDTYIRLAGKTFITPVIFGREGEPNLLGVVALERALLAVDPVGQRLVPGEAIRFAYSAHSRQIRQSNGIVTKFPPI